MLCRDRGNPFMSSEIEILLVANRVLTAFLEGGEKETRPPGAEEKTEVTRRLALAARASAPVDVLSLEYLTIWPDIALHLPPSAWDSPAIRAVILREPEVAFYFLVAHYETPSISHPLEKEFEKQGAEWISLLLNQKRDQRLNQPREHYERLLLKSLWHARQYAVAHERFQFAEAVVNRADELRGQDPQATLVSLLIEESEESVEEHSAILSKEPLTAMLASRMLAHRGAVIDLAHCSPIDPRSACHLKLYGVGINMRDRVDVALAMHPGWAGEFIARSPECHSNWAEVLRLFSLVKEHGSARPVWKDLLFRLCKRIHTASSARLASGKKGA